MGYNLHTTQRTFWLNMTGYRQMLTLARSYGWEPQGTTSAEPAGEVWEGWYFANNQQTITKEDAMGIATALERAIVDLPTEPQVELTIDNRDLAPLAFFAGRHEVIEDFIAFCKEGSITVS